MNNHPSLPTALGRPIHILHQDGRTFLNQQTRIVAPDVYASNGVIQGIDRVLVPADAQHSLEPIDVSQPEAQPPSIFEQLEQDGRFTMLLAHLRAVGMENLVDTKGP